MNSSRPRITLKEFLTTIQTPSDILKAISSSNDYYEELHSDNARTYFIPNQKQKSRILRQQSQSVVSVSSISHQVPAINCQMAALILITPVKFVPSEVFQWCSKLFPTLDRFPQVISAGLMMRFAESSLILNKVETTLQTMRWGINRFPFINVAYLYLCATSKNPIEYEITTLTKYSRVDCMTFYYLGINFLLLRKFEKANQAFIHCLTLNSPSDFSKEIVSDFFLSCFLIHFEEKQARDLISDKIEISEIASGLFQKVDEIELNSEDDEFVSYSDVFKFLLGDINKEIRRRRVLRIALATAKIPVELFVRKAKLSNSEELIDLLKNLKNDRIIGFKVKEEVITFHQPNLEPVIDALYQQLMKLMSELQLLNRKNNEKGIQNDSAAEEDDELFF